MGKVRLQVTGKPPTMTFRDSASAGAANGNVAASPAAAVSTLRRPSSRLGFASSIVVASLACS
jgi:hypothetical protein